MTSVKHPRMLGQLLAELEFLRRFQRQTFDGHELFWASNREPRTRRKP